MFITGGLYACKKTCTSNNYTFTTDEKLWIYYYNNTALRYIKFTKNSDNTYKQDTVIIQAIPGIETTQDNIEDICADKYEKGSCGTLLPSFTDISISLNKKNGVFSAQFYFDHGTALFMQNALPDSDRVINNKKYTNVFKFIVNDSKEIKTAYFVKGVGFIKIELNNGSYCTLF